MSLANVSWIRSATICAGGVRRWPRRTCSRRSGLGPRRRATRNTHYVLVDTLFISALIQVYCREWQTVQTHAETILALGTEYGFARHVALGALLRGTALAAQGQRAEGLTQMRQEHGKRAAAPALLAPIDGWFTDGFDTADLQEARGLLDELT